MIPQLPSKYSYLAIDFPGHGFSSHLQKGHIYHISDYVSILDEIRMKFKWEKLSLIGHSMGSTVSFIYASLYPAQVDLVCTLDNFRPPPIQKITLFMIREHMKKAYAFKMESRQREKEYSYDQMKKFMSGSSVDPSKVIYLLKRGIKTSKRNPNKFQFTRDTRLNYIIPFSLNHEDSLRYLKEIRCPYLYIKTSDLTFEEEPSTFAEALDVFKNHNSNFEMLQVNGTHHAHLNDPKIMADKLSDFVKNHHIEEKNNVNCLQPTSKM